MPAQLNYLSRRALSGVVANGVDNPIALSTPPVITTLG